MANITENLLVREARGNVGKQFVYKKRGNNTNIVKMPRINKNRKPTEIQEEQQDMFSSASLYAQGANSSPVLKQQYQKKTRPGNSAYNVAFRDFLKAPVVKKINLSGYKGQAGSRILVNAKDDFRVESLTLSIRDASGTLVEEGPALQDPTNLLSWIYTIRENSDDISGWTIEAIATDLPGNTGRLEMTV